MQQKSTLIEWNLEGKDILQLESMNAGNVCNYCLLMWWNTIPQDPESRTTPAIPDPFVYKFSNLQCPLSTEALNSSNNFDYNSTPEPGCM